MGHVDLQRVSFALPDGRVLLDEITFRVGDGQKAALIGPNGANGQTDVAEDGQRRPRPRLRQCHRLRAASA